MKKILSASTGRLSLHKLKKHMEQEINREQMSHFQALASKLKVQSCTLAEKLVLVLNASTLFLLLILTNAKGPAVTNYGDLQCKRHNLYYSCGSQLV